MARTQTNGSAAETAADLEAQIAALKSDVAELTDTLSQYGRERSMQIGEVAAQTLETAKQTGAEKAQQIKQQARDGYAGAEKVVRANPAASVGIAAGAGFLVGLLASRR